MRAIYQSPFLSLRATATLAVRSPGPRGLGNPFRAQPVGREEYRERRQRVAAQVNHPKKPFVLRVQTVTDQVISKPTLIGSQIDGLLCDLEHKAQRPIQTLVLWILEYLAVAGDGNVMDLMDSCLSKLAPVGHPSHPVMDFRAGLIGVALNEHTAPCQVRQEIRKIAPAMARVRS